MEDVYCGITILGTAIQHRCGPPMAPSKLCTALDLGQHPVHLTGSHHEASRGRCGINARCLCENVWGIEGPPEGWLRRAGAWQVHMKAGGPPIYMRQRGAPLHSPASACLCLGVAIALPGPASCQQQYQTACQRDLSSSTWQVSGGRLLEQQWEIFRGGSNFVSVTKATAKREI